MIRTLLQWLVGSIFALMFAFVCWRAGFRSGFDRGRNFEARRIAKEREEQAAAEEDEDLDDDAELMIEDREPEEDPPDVS